jgi:transcriptional regulator with XRE-family HTH domain
MGKIANDMMRKKRNEHFIKAFDYVARSLNMTQTELATAIGSKASYISVYRNGTRPVTDEAIEALIRISATIPDGQIYSPYLYAASDYMLLRNVPDAEIIEVERRRNNPDYDLIRHNKSPDPQDHTGNEKAVTDIISLAASLIKETEEMRRQLTEERAEVANLRRQASEELSNIQSLRSKMEADHDTLRTIRAQLSTIIYSLSSNYRIPIAAENQEI